MKIINFLTVITFVAVMILSCISACDRATPKPLPEKTFYEILTENKWRIVNRKEYNKYDELLYEYKIETETEECKKNTYMEFLPDSIYLKHHVCNDTILKYNWVLTSSEKYDNIIINRYIEDDTISSILSKFKIKEYDESHIIFRQDTMIYHPDVINRYNITEYKVFNN